jgi:hypothetical protein
MSILFILSPQHLTTLWPSCYKSKSIADDDCNTFGATEYLDIMVEEGSVAVITVSDYL